MFDDAKAEVLTSLVCLRGLMKFCDGHHLNTRKRRDLYDRFSQELPHNFFEAWQVFRELDRRCLQSPECNAAILRLALADVYLITSQYLKALRCLDSTIVVRVEDFLKRFPENSPEKTFLQSLPQRYERAKVHALVECWLRGVVEHRFIDPQFAVESFNAVRNIVDGRGHTPLPARFYVPFLDAISKQKEPLPWLLSMFQENNILRSELRSNHSELYISLMLKVTPLEDFLALEASAMSSVLANRSQKRGQIEEALLRSCETTDLPEVFLCGGLFELVNEYVGLSEDESRVLLLARAVFPRKIPSHSTIEELEEYMNSPLAVRAKFKERNETIFDMYTLLLNVAITQQHTNAVKRLLADAAKERGFNMSEVLLSVNDVNYSPLTHTLDRGNVEILQTMRHFIHQERLMRKQPTHRWLERRKARGMQKEDLGNVFFLLDFPNFSSPADWEPRDILENFLRPLIWDTEPFRDHFGLLHLRKSLFFRPFWRFMVRSSRRRLNTLVSD